MSNITEVVSNHLEGKLPSPFELVDIEWEKLGSDYILRVLVDKPEGITLQDTADVSEIISPLLDEIKPDPFPSEYMLEVASPGAERPLKKLEDFQKAQGQYVFVSLYQKIDGEKEFIGDLTDVSDESITIDYLVKTRHKTVTIPMDKIAKARTAVKL
jgi:ribosome maturation factor RimP